MGDPTRRPPPLADEDEFDEPDDFDVPDAPPEVGVRLEGLDAERAAALQSEDKFAPWHAPEQIPLNPISETPYADAEPDPGKRLSNAMDRFTQGQTDTASDALFAGAGGTLSGIGINPTQAVGRIGGPAREQATRDRLALAHRRSPGVAGASQLVGEIAPLAIATGGTSAAKQLARPVVGTAIQGGLSGLGDADTDDWGERLEALKESTGLSALIGVGGKAVGKLGGYLGGKAADALRESGLLQRVAASGAYGTDVRNLAANIGGEEGLRKLGEWMEQRGIHTGEGFLGNLLPQPAKVYGDNAAAVNKAAMGNRTAVLDELAQRPPVLVDTLPISSGLRTDAQKLDPAAGRLTPLSPNSPLMRKGIPGGEAKAKAAHMAGLADEIRGKSTQGFQEFPQALETRAFYDDLVSHRSPGGASADPLRGEVNRRVANEYRGALTTGLEQQAPDLAPQFAGAQNDLSKGIDIEQLAEARKSKELGNQLVSLPTMIAAGGGLAASGLGGYGAHKAGGDNQSVGIGALAPLVAAGTAASLLKSRGHAATAGGLRAASGIARGVGNFVRDAAIPVTQAAVRAGQSTPPQPRIDDLAAPSPPPTPAAATASGRGQLLPQAALEAFYTDPQSLGDYQSDFAQAAMSKDSGAVGALISRLVQSRDPKFRQTVLPTLQKRTANLSSGPR